jgi:hypothetical protein
LIVSPLIDAICDSWRELANLIASHPWSEPRGRRKEPILVERLRGILAKNDASVEMEPKVKFDSWYVDLVCTLGSERIAVEAKYKTNQDGAVPDNRKAAFFDLHKLETYVSSGEYSAGLFLWLTNNRSYLRQASGDSSEFSTDTGRIYNGGDQLNARRFRNNDMPIPLILNGDYVFEWQQVTPESAWHTLIIPVRKG